jgi:hypothetical protein
MSVRIQLDNPHAFYTNIDVLSGKIILTLTSDENISAIVVKLEGESNTILVRPAPTYQERQQRRDAVCVENHKILYKVQQVWPTIDPGSGTTLGLAYTLRAGTHEYPFRFKIPINNGCATHVQGLNLGIGGIRLMDLPQQLQYRHVTKTLPPSLSGFPGEAEIRYYVKVTVQRPSFFKENRRSTVGFKFLPIEPPRPAPTTSETFARRSHQFKPGLAGFPKKKGMFGRKTTVPMSNNPPAFAVDARLPSPAILTCNEPIPLRILVKKEKESPENLFLISLSVDLIGYTNVRASDLNRTELGTWVVMSLSNLSIPIGNPADPVGTETLIDSKFWDQVKLPHTVTPSFMTCNLTRSYELEVKVILGFGYPGDIQVSCFLCTG